MLKGNLMPAYGRVYATKAALLKDWEDGKDFKFLNPSSPHHCKYCSIRDFGPGDTLQARFGRSFEFTTTVKGH